MARVKKEDIFYTMLKDLAAHIKDAAELYVNILDNYPDSSAHIPQMKVYENQCDEKVSRIMKELYSQFITPFDREDISELALAMDDIIDNMNAVATDLDLYNVQEMRHEGSQMGELTLRAVTEIQEMIEHLPNYKKDDTVMELAIGVGHIEDEGDTVYQNATRRLFLAEENGRITVTWMRLFDLMEDTLDACDNAAKVVRSVVMKDA